MKITVKQIRTLKKIAKEISTQSSEHTDNIKEYYKIMNDTIYEQFTEDNTITQGIYK